MGRVGEGFAMVDGGSSHKVNVKEIPTLPLETALRARNAPVGIACSFLFQIDMGKV